MINVKIQLSLPKEILIETLNLRQKKSVNRHNVFVYKTIYPETISNVNTQFKYNSIEPIFFVSQFSKLY